ncbi:MAG TPA: GNAT family N-acetyltransferase [Candidatus Angelobacter sp.]|nr:GNAT family N-acetyltransferase [Candidatus Angelobacter sp.]
MTNPDKISLRPVQPSDEELLRELYHSSREAELAQVPWSPEQKQAFVQMQWQAQKRHYAAEYPRAAHVVICREGIPVGRLYIDRNGEAFHILDITLLPEHRNQGTGSILLGRIMEEASLAGKPVTIFVETFNPSLRFFQRLGFTTAEQKGFHFLMKWIAQKPASLHASLTML